MRLRPVVALVLTIAVAGCDRSTTEPNVPHASAPTTGANRDDIPAEWYGPHILTGPGIGILWAGQTASTYAQATFQWVNTWSVTGTLTVTPFNGHSESIPFGGTDGNQYAAPWRQVSMKTDADLTSSSGCGSTAVVTARAYGEVRFLERLISSEESTGGNQAFQDPCPTRTTSERTGGSGSLGGGGQVCWYRVTYDTVTGYVLNKELLYCEPLTRTNG